MYGRRAQGSLMLSIFMDFIFFYARTASADVCTTSTCISVYTDADDDNQSVSFRCKNINNLLLFNQLRCSVCVCMCERAHGAHNTRIPGPVAIVANPNK